MKTMRCGQKIKMIIWALEVILDLRNTIIMGWKKKKKILNWRSTYLALFQFILPVIKLL